MNNGASADSVDLAIAFSGKSPPQGFPAVDASPCFPCTDDFKQLLVAARNVVNQLQDHVQKTIDSDLSLGVHWTNYTLDH